MAARKSCTCSPEAWCPGMSRSMEMSGKGLRTLCIADTKCSYTKRLAALFSGDFVECGIVINFCPFCGKSLKKIHETKGPFR